MVCEGGKETHRSRRRAGRSHLVHRRNHPAGRLGIGRLGLIVRGCWSWELGLERMLTAVLYKRLLAIDAVPETWACSKVYREGP
jgi:hypothetical protein